MTRTAEPRLKVARERAVTAVMEYMDALEDAVTAKTAPTLEPCPWPARRTRALVNKGRLEAVKIGRCWFARPAALARLIVPAPAPATASPANDGEDRESESDADRVLREVLEPRGLRLAAPVRRTAR